MGYNEERNVVRKSAEENSDDDVDILVCAAVVSFPSVLQELRPILGRCASVPVERLVRPVRNLYHR